MFFQQFRRIVQDYCREYDIPFLSFKKYKELHRAFKTWHAESGIYFGEEEDDISVGKFLDTREDMNSFQEKCMANACVQMNYNLCITDDCASTPVPCAPCKPVPKFTKGMVCKQQQEVENTMTVNSERDYLVRRIRDTMYSFNDKLSAQFNMNSDNTPKTYQQLIDAIKNGLYTLDPKRSKVVDAKIVAAEASGEDVKWSIRGPFDGIKWNLPGAPDPDGYDASQKAMNAAYQSALDVIQTSDASVGLKAFQDFQGWTFTPATPAA